MLSKEIFHISPLVRTISSLSATTMSAFTRKLDNLNNDQLAGLFGRADANRDLIMEQERDEAHNALYDDLKSFYEKYTKEKMGKKGENTSPFQLLIDLDTKEAIDQLYAVLTSFLVFKYSITSGTNSYSSNVTAQTIYNWVNTIIVMIRDFLQENYIPWNNIIGRKFDKQTLTFK